MARVTIKGVTREFSGAGGERIRALDGATLAVEDKELLTIVGPSGSGKTTLLRLIAGLDEPDAGTIALDGKVQNGVPPQDRDVAMVFQHHALYPHLTAAENLAFGLKLRKVPWEEILRRVAEAAEMLKIAHCLNRRPAGLSGGERQRVALGRALVRHPRVFLLDEPLSQLDAPLRAQMRSEIAALQARLGVTMIYVTHDQAEAMALGQRVAVMHQGAVQQVAEPRQLQEHPANLFVAGFIGKLNAWTG
jgi:multiple sugar transport system ATP-binding protein